MDISQIATLPSWDTTSPFPWLMITISLKLKTKYCCPSTTFVYTFSFLHSRLDPPIKPFCFISEDLLKVEWQPRPYWKRSTQVSSGSSVLLRYCTVAPSELVNDVYPCITLISCSSIYYSFNCVAQICEILLRLIIELCYVRPSARAAVVVGR